MTPPSVSAVLAQTPVVPFKPLTKADVADLLSITPRCVEQWVEQGVLPRWKKIGGRSYWHPDVIYGRLAVLLKLEESDLAAATPTVAVNAAKGKTAASGVQAQNARRLLRISQSAGGAAPAEPVAL